MTFKVKLSKEEIENLIKESFESDKDVKVKGVDFKISQRTNYQETTEWTIFDGIEIELEGDLKKLMEDDDK